MAEYRSTDGRIEEAPRRSSLGNVLLMIVLVAIVLVGILFATGFFSAKVTQDGQMPTVSVKADAGSLPQVDLNSKKVVVGTKPTTVDVPTVETKKATIDVPVVGVKN
ncbi:MAG: hypothetical protein ABIM50_12935 [Novosphingobium sp.]